MGREQTGSKPLNRFQIRPANPDDLPAVRWIEAVALEQGRSPETWRAELADPAHRTLVAVTDASRVVGFCAFTCVGGEAEINHFAVVPEFRRRGVASRLLEDTMAVARDSGCRVVFLDVRRRNRVARDLYRKAGFRQVGIRRGYYRAPPDDALLLRRDL